MSYVPTYQLALHTYLLMRYGVLRAYVLSVLHAYMFMTNVPCMLTCQDAFACLRAHKPTCLTCLRTHVPTRLALLRACVLRCLTCSSGQRIFAYLRTNVL